MYLSVLYCDVKYRLVSMLDQLDVVLSINLQLDVHSVTQLPEVVAPCMFGGQDLELLLRAGEDVAIRPHFNHKGFVRGSSYLAGEDVTVPLLLEKVNLLGESMHLKVLETKPRISFR